MHGKTAITIGLVRQITSKTFNLDSLKAVGVMEITLVSVATTLRISLILKSFFEVSPLIEIKCNKTYFIQLTITFRNARITYQCVWPSFLPVQHDFV